MIKEVTEIQLIVGKLFKEITGREFDKDKDKEIITGVMELAKKGGKLTLRERLMTSFGLMLLSLESDRLSMFAWEVFPEEEKDTPLGGSKKEAK